LNYIIGSFNLRDFNFSNKSADGKEKIERDFEKIANIIIEEKFDVIALQEVNAPLPLNHLTNILNRRKNFLREYACVFGENMPDKNISHDPERYGFIWNTKRLSLLKTKSNNPRYYKNAGALQLIRPPYFARFTARGLFGGSNFELRIINTHIKFGKTLIERHAEYNILVQQILPRICDLQEITENGELMPSYTFLMGDYNLELNKSEHAIYKISTITSTNYTGKLRNYITVQEEPTTLRESNDQTTIEECYANNYDHFTYEIDLDKKLMLQPQRVEALSKYYTNGQPSEKLEEYRKEISDHVPIKLIVNISR